MMALGLDVSACARFEPATMADLQVVCRSCRKRGRCAIDLAKRADAPTELSWKDYCPNAARLGGLVLANRPIGPRRCVSLSVRTPI